MVAVNRLMAKDHFRASQNVVLIFYLASILSKSERENPISRVRDAAVRSAVPPKVEGANTGVFYL